MAIEIISGFLNNSSEPVDVKEQVADQTARLALTFPYVGLRAKQLDTNQIFEYIGVPPSNIASDWELRPTLRTGTIAPDNADGADGDIYFNTSNNYIYEKSTATSTWGLLADLTGAQIFQGTAAPDDGNGVNGDIYFRSNGDVHQKSGGTWGAPLFNIAGSNGLDGDRYSATSTTSTNIPTSHPTDVALTLDASTYAYTPGQSVVAAEDATNFFEGTVKTYVGAVLTITSSSNTGTGSAPTTSWTVNLDGATGQQGAAGKPGVPDKTYTGATGFIFNDQEVADIQNDVFGTWTVDNPFLGYIIIDGRETIGSPAAISGDQAGNLLEWNGTAWRSLGRIKGDDGDDGFRGWSPVLGTATRNSDEEVLQLTAWTGGSGALPSTLTSLIGQYVSGSGLVADINLATNIRGPKGDQGDSSPSIVFKTFGHPASLNFPIGSTFSDKPDVYPKNWGLFGFQAGGWNFASSNEYSSEGNETIWIRARAAVYNPGGGSRNQFPLCAIRLYASRNGTFDPQDQYGLILLDTVQYAIPAGQVMLLDSQVMFKFPGAQGSWYFKLTASAGATLNWPGNDQVEYSIVVVHRQA